MSAAFHMVGQGILAVDTQYVRRRMDASHLVVDGQRALFVDAGTSQSVPHLLSALEALDLDVDAVDYIVLTHVHLDHAGGAGALAAALPHAQVLVHPRGAIHMVDPSLLVAATKAVYGESRFAREYGEVLPIAADRVTAMQDGERISWGGRAWEFIHTPGHALHHLCMVDRDAAEIFAGDTFGVSYRELDSAAGEFIFPSTSPSQFDPLQLHASIDRILAFRPKCAYLTHYSRVGEPERLGQDLHADIDAFVRIARHAAAQQDRVEVMKRLLFDHLSARLERHGHAGNHQQRHAVLDGDIELNAAGLNAWLSRRRS